MDQDLPPTSPLQPSPPVAPMPPVPTAAAAAPRRNNARILNVALAGALVLAVAGVSFAAGRVTAPAAPAGFRGGAFPGNGNVGPGASGAPNGRGGGFLGGGGATIEGTVESVSDTTLTLKTTDGQTIQIALSDTTTYHAQTDASASAVAAGGKVLVRIGFRGGQGTGTAPGAGNLSATDVTTVP